MTYHPVTKPLHYNVHPSGIECIEISRHLSFCQGNAFKYVWRFRWKNGREDLEKAIWYLSFPEANSPAPRAIISPLATVIKHEPNVIIVSIFLKITTGLADQAIKEIHRLIDNYDDLQCDLDPDNPPV
jgi:hypothetical protein